MPQVDQQHDKLDGAKPSDLALLPGLREALLWKPNTPQLENAMTYAWEQALKSFIRALEESAPRPELQPLTGETPRTDAAAHYRHPGISGMTGATLVDASFARQLERELAEAKRELEAETALATRTMVERDALESALSATQPSDPDGYAVVLDDKASSPRGYWFAYAYIDEDTAAKTAEQVKGRVQPIFFAPASTTQHRLDRELLQEAFDLFSEDAKAQETGADAWAWKERAHWHLQGLCPRPFPEDDGTQKDCNAKGNCGCVYNTSAPVSATGTPSK